MVQFEVANMVKEARIIEEKRDQSMQIGWLFDHFSLTVTSLPDISRHLALSVSRFQEDSFVFDLNQPKCICFGDFFTH